METTEYTLQKGFVKNDMHLLLCEDIIWSNWVLIMDTYGRGGLPNTKGETIAPTIAEQKKRIPIFKKGKIQQAPGTVALGPTLFRCIAGLESTEVLSLQTALLDKTIILKKGKHTKDMVDMEEFAWNRKVDRVLKAAIIDFFNDLTTEMLTWDQICEKYKLGDYEYNQLKSYTEVFVKDSLNRTKKKPSLPSTAVTLLHHVYRASMDQGTTENSIPWTIKGVGLDMQKLETFCEQFNVPFQLAIMDARSFCKDLSIETFSTITKCLNAMNSRLEYIFVCFVEFVNIYWLVEGVRAQAGKMLYEVGTISKDNEQSLAAGVGAYASVVLFISKGNSFDSIDKAPGEKVFMSTSASARGDTIDKDFLLHLIEGFSPEQNYVVDLFSGGIVLQQSLMSKRRCIALCKDDLEAMALEAKCSQILEDSPEIREWCGDQKSSQNQVIKLDDAARHALDNVEIDEQASGDDEDEDSNDDEEEVPKESNFVIKQNEDKENDRENQPGSSVDKELEKSGDEHCKDKDKEKEEASFVHQSNEEKEKEEASFVHQSNEEKEREEDKLNKDNDNVEEISKIGRLKI